MSRRDFDSVAVGDQLPEIRDVFDRERLVRYAAAAADFNAIHWSDRVAREVGLPGVLAHGMLTMGAASRVLTEWAGEPAAVLAYSTRFTRPVAVPDPGVAEIVVSGAVRSVDQESRTVVVDVTVSHDGATVLTKARATLALG